MKTRLRYVGMLNAMLVGTCLIGAPAFAQTAPEPSPATADDPATVSVADGEEAAVEAPVDDQSRERVVVTGTRSTSRTVENSAAPIDVLSSEVLLSTGEGNLLQAL